MSIEINFDEHRGIYFIIRERIGSDDSETIKIFYELLNWHRIIMR